MTDTLVAEVRGSISVMCRAELPAARRFDEPSEEDVEEEEEEEEEEEPSAVKLNSGCAVVRVETSAPVARSHVRSVWSHDAEYATVGSAGLNITAETGAVCAVRSARGPR